MSKDLLGQNAHEQNAELKLHLHADSGYTADSSHRASALQYQAVLEILKQPRPHHTHESGHMEATLLFTADDSSTGKKVAVYACQADGEPVYFGTCPLDEWQDEFSKVNPKN